MITITKEFSFEMSHQLEGYNGKCKNIHGHSYRLFVSVRGTPIADAAHPHYGMVMDFAALKLIVNQQVISIFDHSLVLKKDVPLHHTLQTSPIHIVAVDYQPTCENILLDIAQRLQNVLPPAVQLAYLRLYETATSYAEWEADLPSLCYKKS
ncbi:6-carboxytetrahydropterin synthase QueD [Bacteroidia bacterium]|nr:6-carboxytetrahydropterin synthase QueD [Bacteroidia bacterium]